MTAAARELLKDANTALQMLEEEENSDRWRVLWFAAVTMARSIGHVLHKVDTKHNRKLKAASRAAYEKWQSLPEHKIFHQFIEIERNSLVKENLTSAEGYSDIWGIVFTDENGVENIESIEAILYRPIMCGPYQGVDARDVLSEALEWWATELDKLDLVTVA
jgi:predicted nucleic acid-binding protein